MGGGDVDMKKTLSLLLALVVLCTLTACSKQETSDIFSYYCGKVVGGIYDDRFLVKPRSLLWQ